MSAEEFWKDDPQLFYSYRISFINKKKREMEELDYKCWYQGLYIFDGIGKLISSLKQFLGNIFSDKRDRTPIESYPQKPYNELANDKKKENIEKQKRLKYEEFDKSFQYYGTMKQRYLDSVKKRNK